MDDINKVPLVVITGPTASGKTSLAIKLAKKFGGEIICADSRTVYKGMDIGTAKPTKFEQAEVPHWGLDLVEPGDPFSASDFKKYAMNMIGKIRERGNIPFLVGGTGLYIDSIIFDYEFGPKADSKQREECESMTLEQLWAYCYNNNINLPENKHNKRYVIRNIERNGVNLSSRRRMVDDIIVVAISTDRMILKSRISQRVEQLLHDGVVEEAKMLGKIYGWDSEAMTGNAYRLIKEYINGRLSFDEVQSKMTTIDWRLAKRQITWLKRNPKMKWVNLEDAEIFISGKLAKLSQS